MVTFKPQVDCVLSNIAETKKVVFFVGAGISVSAGYPLWKDASQAALRLARSRGLSTPLQKFTNVFLGSARGAQFGEQCRKILTGELPFEGASGGLPVVLKIEEALGDGVEVVKIVGRQDLPLDD